ncbi:PRE_C2HC domain-containing protein [Trichonephila clavipes]|nr:PRE_C2HC domain-containing protein [Trichonephila clavipes]
MNLETGISLNQNGGTPSLHTTQNTTPNTTQFPPPVMLKCTGDYIVLVKTLMQVMPTLRTCLTCDFLKLYTNNFDQYRELIHILENLKYQFYVIKPKTERPFKIFIKELPRNTNVEDIKEDLLEQGFVTEKVIQLIGRKTKQPLPVFLITLPRSMENLNIFDLKALEHLSNTVDGYNGKGITQCFRCTDPGLTIRKQSFRQRNGSRMEKFLLFLTSIYVSMNAAYRERRMWAKVRSSGWWERIVLQSWDDDDFKENFRVS